MSVCQERILSVKYPGRSEIRSKVRFLVYSPVEIFSRGFTSPDCQSIVWRAAIMTSFTKAKRQ